MEYEVRFYHSNEKAQKIIKKLEEEKELNKGLKTYEKTVQYNHCDPRYDFYSKEIDGRFRIRISKNDENSKCKLSWKRRLFDTIQLEINKEEEKELRINFEDTDNLFFIIENVIKFSVVESYERYRTVFENKDVEISVDEYPFGIAIEVENKSEDKDPIEVIKYWTIKLGLDLSKAYRLSWDDKYQELCKEQQVEIFNEVCFGKPMPVIKD